MIFPTPGLWLPTPRVFYSPGYPACCDGSAGIGDCAFCASGKSIDTLEIGFEGFVDNNCGNCDPDLNDIFLCAGNSFRSDFCKWRYSWPGTTALCSDPFYPGQQAAFVSAWLAYGLTQPVAGVTGIAGEYWLLAEINTGQGSGSGHLFRTSFGATKPDCSDWEDLDLPFLNNDPFDSAADYMCDPAAASCTVSAWNP